METIDLSKRGESLVNVVPRGNNVLIKMEFNVSLMALTSGNPEASKEKEEVIASVAGFGPMVHNLDLGEVIVFKVMHEYIDVIVEGNKNSIPLLKEKYNRMPKLELNKLMGDKDAQNVSVTQYGIFPEYEIPAHYKQVKL